MITRSSYPKQDTYTVLTIFVVEDQNFFIAPGNVDSSLSENSTLSLLDLLDLDTFSIGTSLVAFFFDIDGGINGEVEYFLNASRFLCAAFDVCCTHLFCHGLSLLWGDWSETLGAKKFNTGALIAEVGFQAHQNQRGCRTEMEHFGIPLYESVNVIGAQSTQ